MAASLAALQTSPPKTVSGFQGGRPLVGCSPKCKGQHHYIHSSWTQNQQWAQATGWWEGKSEPCHQGTSHRGARERVLWKPWLQKNDKLPTDGVSHRHGVQMRHPHTQAEALPCWAELDSRSSRPRWLRRSPGGTPAVCALLLRTGKPSKPQKLTGSKVSKAGKKQISFERITSKVVRTFSFKTPYAKGM